MDARPQHQPVVAPVPAQVPVAPRPQVFLLLSITLRHRLAQLGVCYSDLQTARPASPARRPFVVAIGRSSSGLFSDMKSNLPAVAGNRDKLGNVVSPSGGGGAAPTMVRRPLSGRVGELAARFEALSNPNTRPGLQTPVRTPTPQRQSSGSRLSIPSTSSQPITPYSSPQGNAVVVRLQSAANQNDEHKHGVVAVNPCEEGRAYTPALQLSEIETLIRHVNEKDPSIGLTSAFFQCRKVGCGLLVCLACSTPITEAQRNSHVCRSTFEDKVDELYAEVVEILAKVGS
jgi:hypothetical protein